GTLSYYHFGTTLGGEFQLDNVNLQVNVTNTFTLVMTGYLDGAAVSGATETITYATNVAQTVDVSSNAAFDNIDEIRFEFTATPDNNGNVILNSLQYSTAVAAASPVAVSVAGTDAGCALAPLDGKVVATVTPGTANYTYSWSDGTINSNVSATSDSITGLAAGTYTVTVTDAAGTTATASTTISAPAVMSLGITTDSPVVCNGDMNAVLTANVSGATPPYTFSWNTGATTQSLTGVGAGTYTVNVQDANNCLNPAAATIVTEPFAISASASGPTDVSCNGASDGAASFSFSGGVTPYTYLWSNGSTNSSLSGVSGGTYTLTMTDANGCVVTTAGVGINEPAALILDSVVVDSNVTCSGDNDGGATAHVSGGNSTYTYIWSNGANTAFITGVAPGTYTVTVTDENNCGPVSQSVMIQEEV
ncbi:MAG: SprB repeat-containing protein, partial [Bacteroidota bacterium]